MRDGEGCIAVCIWLSCSSGNLLLGAVMELGCTGRAFYCYSTHRAGGVTTDREPQERSFKSVADARPGRTLPNAMRATLAATSTAI